jgi:hypothetical protein
MSDDLVILIADILMYELLYRWEGFDLIRFPYMGQSAIFVGSLQSLVRMATQFIPEEDRLLAGQCLCKSFRNLPDLTTHVLDCRTEVSCAEIKFFSLMALARAKRDVTVSGLPRELKFPDTDSFANTVLRRFLGTILADERKERLSIGIGWCKSQIAILDEICADLAARRGRVMFFPLTLMYFPHLCYQWHPVIAARRLMSQSVACGYCARRRTSANSMS